MSSLSATTMAARRGQPLAHIVQPRVMDTWKPVELSVTQRHDLIDVWTAMFDDIYVHYSQKRALYGFDPIRTLRALRRQMPYLDSAGFLRELTVLINRLRDQHTQLYVDAADQSLAGYVAALPFLVEAYGSHLSPTFVVTKTTNTIDDDNFTVGARVTTWNGIPFGRAVDLYAETLTGGRPDARRARALETLTQRPLEYLSPPDELWVDIGYQPIENGGDNSGHTIRFEWQAIEPGQAITANNLIEARTRRAISVTSETARRARKLLFAPELWDRDQTSNAATAKKRGWMSTTFADAVSARQIKTSHGTFGYIRLWTFDVEHTARFISEMAGLLRRMPRKGLIVDLRSNPGGVIDTTERLLQLFRPKPIEPARFACRATPAMVQITEADGNGADLADWAASTRAAVELGEEFSQHLPITDPDAFKNIKRAYTGPVVAVVDANTFSCGDLFAAGIADLGIGQIISVSKATGAGGANVWTSDDIQFAYHAAKRDLPPIPPGISFTISVRRMIRTGQSAGLAIEDIGVAGNDHYEMTYHDLLNGNPDLAEFCTKILATT
ncbi:S41 family peptidase [Nocardia fluminea]|uniref:S41 family peptidase n=1 Tax=Nocardia fluminea TaxID=134984 RepID=UPI0033D81CC6